jgi:hypothetical protein
VNSKKTKKKEETGGYRLLYFTRALPVVIIESRFFGGITVHLSLHVIPLYKSLVQQLGGGGAETKKIGALFPGEKKMIHTHIYKNGE